MTTHASTTGSKLTCTLAGDSAPETRIDYTFYFLGLYLGLRGGCAHSSAHPGLWASYSHYMRWSL